MQGPGDKRGRRSGLRQLRSRDRESPIVGKETQDHLEEVVARTGEHPTILSGSSDLVRWVWVGLGCGLVAAVMDRGEIDSPFYNLLM